MLVSIYPPGPQVRKTWQIDHRKKGSGVNKLNASVLYDFGSHLKQLSAFIHQTRKGQNLKSGIIRTCAYLHTIFSLYNVQFVWLLFTSELWGISFAQTTASIYILLSFIINAVLSAWHWELFSNRRYVIVNVIVIIDNMFGAQLLDLKINEVNAFLV